MLSGTSYDAVDATAADLELAEDTLLLRPLGLHSREIPESLRARIAAVLPPHATSAEEICRLDTELGQLFGELARELCQRAAAELVVSHGQTVFHWVEDERTHGTLQLGSPAWIAAATGLPVVSDLRTADIARGGHGAPLTSTVDAMLLRGRGYRCGALNLGGIANITVVAGGDVIAYDIGPANALIDAAVARQTDGRERMDRGGRRAARGRVDRDVLDDLLDEPYYRRPPPKSTGKELFHAGYLDGRAGGDDLVATLTELTAALVGRACRAHRLDDVFVSGGGVRNPVLMARIAALSAPTRIRPSDELGLPAQAKEAYVFAVLGFLTVHGLAGTIPAATGAARPALLGSITPGANPLRLPDPVVRRPTRLRIA